MKEHKFYFRLNYPLAIILLLLVQTTACQSIKEGNASKEKLPTEILPAINHTSKYFDLLKGKRVGVVVNAASVINNSHLVDTLLKSNINVASIFTPEHGFFSNKSDGEHLSDHSYKGIPISSLYGKNRKPKKEDIEPLDIILFDLQDVGLRFYTYISTLHYIIEVCNENNKKLIVLDRPNPFINVVDGPVLEREYVSFVGMHEVPTIYGMTIGEYALMIVGENWIDSEEEVDLEIITIDNYSGSSYYELPIAPSPNLPNHASIMNYPSLCFFEGTDISIGRGTEGPFQCIGHPELPIGNQSLTPRVMESSKWPKHQDKLCSYRILDYKTDIDTSILDLRLLFEMNDLFKQSNLELINRVEHFDRIAGTSKLRLCLSNKDCDFDTIRKSWAKDLGVFKDIRSKYMLYPRQ